MQVAVGGFGPLGRDAMKLGGAAGLGDEGDIAAFGGDLGTFEETAGEKVPR